jgi:hypothetical protein
VGCPTFALFLKISLEWQNETSKINKFEKRFSKSPLPCDLAWRTTEEIREGVKV